MTAQSEVRDVSPMFEHDTYKKKNLRPNARELNER